MDKNKPIIAYGQVINIAEHTTYLELTSRVCYYNEPNLNNDMLPYDENSEKIAESLVNMPVQARYRVSPDGNPTFGSHEMHKSKDGKVTFGTVSIGTHIKTWIEKDNVTVNDGTIKELPCLFAIYRLWKRYPNMIAAAKRLFDEGKLYNSWELNTYQYLYDNGIRKLTDYEFLADTLLGYEYSYPSYGTSANAISMAELNDNAELLIAEALANDIYNNENKEEILKMAKQNKPVVAEDATNIETPTDTNIVATDDNINHVESSNNDNVVGDDELSVKTAQLTEWDLRDKIREACRTKLGKWCYISYHFPVDKEVWCEYDGAESELDYVKFTYEVGEGDSVTVSEPTYVKLTVSIAEVNTKISELEKEVETVKAELDIKNDAITKASETIQNLNVQISELTPYKEQIEAAEQKRIETEIAEDKERLKAKMLKGNLFTEAEIAEKNIADLIEARDESAINSLIADKFVASFDNKEAPGETQVTENAKTETATASLETDEDTTDARSFMRSILLNK